MNPSISRSFSILCLGLVLLVAIPATAPADDKIPVENLTDLPIHSYPIEGTVSGLLESDTAFESLAASLRKNLEATLDKYDIKDASTLRRMYATLMTLDVMDGRDEDALKWIDLIRELEDKEAARLMTGITTVALVAARAAGEPGSAAYTETFEKKLEEQVSVMPWDVVQDRIQAGKGRGELLSRNLIVGMAQSEMDPIVAKSGELSSDLAERVVNFKYAIDVVLPLKEQRLAVYQRMIDRNAVEKENIWPQRNVELDAERGLKPITIAVWDSGVDAAVFGKAMFHNKAEKPNGKDDDGNGFVDDIHGIAFDVNGNYSTELLHPHGDQTGKVEGSMKWMKGLTDLQAAVDSKEASALKKHVGSLPPEEVEDFITGLGFCGLCAHGTHVAGIMSEGNPFAEIIAARISFDYHSLPAPVTKEIAQRHADSYASTVKYFQKNGVRVTNMSWGWTFREIEQSLEANGIGETAEERQAMTEEIFGILDKGLHDAMASVPDILFVVAAGNDDSDVAFNRNIPTAYEMPNLMVVGAVDQAGERTSFTSMGENVVVYANGFEVMSYVPGGERMAMSGTSMSSPNAANLAGKLFAVRPELTPTEVISLIEKGADRLEDGSELLLINPKATVALVEGM